MAQTKSKDWEKVYGFIQINDQWMCANCDYVFGGQKPQTRPFAQHYNAKHIDLTIDEKNSNIAGIKSKYNVLLCIITYD